MGETIGVNILRRASDMEISPQFDGYSAVRIYVGTNDSGESVFYEAGNTNGRTLEIKNPLGTQAMANNILADIQGYQYQPLKATDALLNPAAEMGDGVTVNGVYSGIFTRNTQFGRLMASDISAPTEEEIEHEFAIESPSDRQYTRFVQQTRSMLSITNLAIQAEVEARQDADTAMQATLDIQATQIAAKVSQTGGNNSSFGWTLTSSGHTWYSGNTQVMKVNASGLEVRGKITATSGAIGGFTIGSSSIYSNGMSSMTSGQTTGVHVGTDGIKLGQRFTVYPNGNVTATRLSVDTLVIGGTDVSAATLNSRANSAYNSTSAGGYCYDGAGAGYSAQNTWNNAQNPSIGVRWLVADSVYAKNYMQIGSYALSRSSAYVKDSNGNTVLIKFWSY